jgi:hypothetical protein
MRARWASFGVGLWLVFAPLALGHGTAGAVLHDVALGLLACLVALAALDWPVARFAALAPAAWLAFGAPAIGLTGGALRANHLAAAALLALLALVPSARARRREAHAAA